MVHQRDRTQQSPSKDDGGPSPRTNLTQEISSVSRPMAPQPSIVFLTINVNAWQPFKTRWAAEGTPPEIQSATVLLLQEHKITSQELCSDAVEWCARQGWRAVFRPAATLATGKPSGGVAILIADRADVGVTDLQLRAPGYEHRLLGLRLVAPGMNVILASAYLQAGGGMNITNRTLLSTIAQWQESTQTPVLVGGDFNLKADLIRSTDYLVRGGLSLQVPRGPTYRTASCRTTIDYYLVSTCLCNKLQKCQVLSDFPLNPHSPVRLECLQGELEWVPVLDSPIKLPTEKPFGPEREERDWTQLADRVEQAHQYLTRYRGGTWENVQVLDQVYAEFVRAFEEQICLRTDTPMRRVSTRGRPPRVRWVDGSKRAKRQLKSWRSLERPLIWMTHWVQNVIRYNSGNEEDLTATLLEAELAECPTEFHSIVALIGLRMRAQTIIRALIMDELACTSCQELNAATLQTFLGEVSDALDQEHRSLQQGHLRSWKDWVRESSREHRGWAHKWSTIKEQWKPQRVPAGSTFTGKPRECIEQERTRLRAVWECSERQEEWYQADESDFQLLPAITVEGFMRAVRSFSRRTASTWDGFHPRHYCLLGEAQVEVVLEVIALVERVGVFPTVLQAILARMIPKHKAEEHTITYRAIGLLPSLHRLWARLRKEESRRWEERNRSPMIAHQSGRSIMDVVFLQSLRSESAACTDKPSYTAAFLWDLSNYYEFVDRQLLWERARSRRFNTVIVALALNQYSAQRYVSMEDLCLDCGYPARGIAAGCGFATVFVQIYTLDPLQIWQSACPDVGLTIFIDDLLGESTAESEHQVVGRLAAGAATLQQAIQDELRCKVATHKSVLIASNGKLLQKLRAAFGRFGGQASRSASNLGVDYYAGRRQARRMSTKTLQGRTKKLLRRCRRLHSLKKAGYDMKSLFITGLQQASLYGAEVTGLNPKELHSARASYLQLVGPAAPSTSSAITLAITGDPLWRQGLGPVITWSTIVWKSAVSQAFQALVDIPRLGQMAAPAIKRLPQTWGGVRGPLGAAHLSLRRIGWRFLTPFSLESASGETFLLTSTSPALLSYHLQLDWKRAVGTQAGRSLGLDNCQVDPTIYRRVMGSQELSGKDKAILRGFVGQAIWSPQRLHAVGYDIDVMCSLCEEAPDSLGHRLFQCRCTQDLREQHLDAYDVEYLKYHDDRSVLGAGLQRMPEPIEPRRRGMGHEEVEEWTVTGGPIEDFLYGEVFTDGSCFKHGPPTWNQAGWAVCKVSRDGALLAWMRGAVGGQLPQSSGAAEYVAALALTTRATREIEALVDYQGLIGLLEASLDTISYRKNIYSGLKLQTRAKAPRGSTFSKVQAHVNPETCTDPMVYFRAIGNEHADKVAKEAARSTQSPTREQLLQYHLQCNFLNRFLKYVPKALGRWPTIGPTDGKRCLPKRPGAAVRTGRASFQADVLGILGGPTRPAGDDRAPPQPQATEAPRAEAPQEGARRHDWRWKDHRWLCVACLTTARTSVPPRLGKCPGMASNIVKLLQNPRKHKLLIATCADGKGVVVVCSRCGHHTTSNRTVQLHKEDCKALGGQASFASPGAEAAYTRISEGKHPKHAKGEAKVLDPCFPLASLAAWARAGQEPASPPN